MNLLLLMADEVVDAHVVLKDSRARHVREVLRAQVGQELTAGVVGYRPCKAMVVALDGEEVVLRLGAAFGEPASTPLLSLAVALPRPKALLRVVETAASFGIAEIALINAWKVEKAYFQSPKLEPRYLLAAAARGCEQGGHTILPQVRTHRRFMQYVDTLGKRDETWRWLFDPSAKATLVSAGGTGEKALLAFGPEGGWIPQERETWLAHGFQAVALATPILRTEIAIATALGQVALCRSAVGR